MFGVTTLAIPDVIKSGFIRLTVLAKQLGKHVSTVHRWRLHGRRGVVLDCFLIGGAWYTTWEAVDAFIEQTTAAASRGRKRSVSVRPRPAKPPQRQLPDWTEQQLNRIFGPRREKTGNRHASGCDATNTQPASGGGGDCPR